MEVGTPLFRTRQGRNTKQHCFSNYCKIWSQIQENKAKISQEHELENENEKEHSHHCSSWNKLTYNGGRGSIYNSTCSLQLYNLIIYNNKTKYTHACILHSINYQNHLAFIRKSNSWLYNKSCILRICGQMHTINLLKSSFWVMSQKSLSINLF